MAQTKEVRYRKLSLGIKKRLLPKLRAGFKLTRDFHYPHYIRLQRGSAVYSIWWHGTRHGLVIRIDTWRDTRKHITLSTNLRIIAWGIYGPDAINQVILALKQCKVIKK